MGNTPATHGAGSPSSGSSGSGALSTARQYLQAHNGINPNVFAGRTIGTRQSRTITWRQAAAMRETLLGQALDDAFDVDIQYTSHASPWYTGAPNHPVIVLTFPDGSVLDWLTNQTHGQRTLLETHDTNPCGCTASYRQVCA